MEKSNIKFYLLILGVSIALLVVSLVFFYKPSYLYRPIHRFWATHSYRMLNVNDVNTIRPWMTFDYINKVFKLPADYLKNILNISNSHYPNVSFGSYAKEEKVNPTDFITKVREAVHNYLTLGK